MSRVPFLATANRGVGLLTNLNAAVARAQEQIATGRAILNPADDPSGAAQVLLIERSIDALTQFSRNADLAETRIQREEAALGSVNDILQRARELVIQGANATQSVETRGFIADELRGLREQLLQTANSNDGNGRYLFAGFQIDQPPFVERSGQVEYHGDQGVRQIQIGTERSIVANSAGTDIFFQVPRANGTYSVSPSASNSGSGVVATLGVSDSASYNNGTFLLSAVTADSWEVRDSGGALVQSGTYTSGEAIEFNGLSITLDGPIAAGDSFSISPAGRQSIFDTMDQAIAALDSGASSSSTRAQQTSELNRALENLDQAFGKVSSVRTDIGVRLETIEIQRDLNEGYRLVSQEALADIRDLDYTAAISNLSQQLTALEAAQAAFARVQGLSLFNVL